MSKRMKIADLWDYLPPEARYVAMDKNGEWHWYAGAINQNTTEWFRIDDERYVHIGIAIDYTGDWKDSLQERPQDIKPGMFGKFWDGDKEPADDKATWGYLSFACTGDTAYKYDNGVDNFAHFRPCLPAAQVEI